MITICPISFRGGGETCGSVAKRTNKNATPLYNTISEHMQTQARPFVSNQFSNTFNAGAFGYIKNMAK